jgi:hypothetical protein
MLLMAWEEITQLVLMVPMALLVTLVLEGKV